MPQMDEHFMRIALTEAASARDKDEVPIGAVLVINDAIIARAHNQIELLHDVTAHAEILALTSAFAHLGVKYLPEATLYVTLEPCLMCCGAIYWSKIKRLVYGANDEKNGFNKWTAPRYPLHPKTILTTGILSDECKQIVQDFFKTKR